MGTAGGDWEVETGGDGEVVTGRDWEVAAGGDGEVVTGRDWEVEEVAGGDSEQVVSPMLLIATYCDGIPWVHYKV